MTPIIASTSSRSVSPSSSPSSRARTLTSSSRRVPPSSPPSPPAVLAPLLLPLQVEPLRLHRLKRRRRIKWKRRRVRRLRICRVALPSRRIKLTSRSHTTPQSPTTTWASDSSTKRFASQRLSYLVASLPQNRSSGKAVAACCSVLSVTGAVLPHRVPNAEKSEATVCVLRFCSALAISDKSSTYFASAPRLSFGKRPSYEGTLQLTAAAAGMVSREG